MLQITSSRRLCFISMFRRLMRQNSTSVRPELDSKKKKKFSELTPQEIENELKENLVRLRKSFESDERENYVVPIFKKSILHGDQPAIKDSNGEYTYIQMYVSAKRLATQISNICGSASMKNIGYLCANNVLSPLTQWACWISGQVAMPLNMCNSVEMLKALLKDSKASALIVTHEYENLGWDLTEALDISLVIIDHSFMVSSNTTLLSVPRVLLSTFGTVIVEGTCSNDFYTKANAMLLYTTGTTGKPKGAMITHRSLQAQIKSLVNAWKFDSNDCLLHALPMHHSHGFINAFMCPLSVGGRIIMHDQFSSKNIWSSLLGINMPVKDRINFFMAVPTVYKSLIAEYEKSLSKNIKMVGYISNYCKENIRLMVSGGAPLPPTVYRRWREITGHSILECYGTTEFGVALSNPYVEGDDGYECTRQPGVVGLPLPDVRVRLVGENDKVLIDCIGEYVNDRWSVQFLDTKTSSTTQNEANQLDTSHTETAELGKQSKPENFFNKRKLSDIFVETATKVAENFLVFTAKTATDLLKTLKQAKKNTESKCVRPSKSYNEVEESEKSDFSEQRVFAAEINSEQKNEKQKDEKKKDNKTHDFTTILEPAKDNIFDPKESMNPIGELQVCGPHLFKTYIGNSEATVNAYTGDFFKTGDLATFQDGVFKILGRTNIDVIEIAGKQISSYDIESLILEHPYVRDVTVITVQDGKDNNVENGGGEARKPSKALGVVCVLHQKAQLDLNSLNIFCSKSLPQYLLPTKLKIVDELPRSNMAKVNRQALLELFHEVESEPKKSVD